MSKINYKSGSFGFGQNIADYPPPRIRKFPNDAGVPREVRVKITSWVGVSLGATHTYCEVTEEDNPFWDGELWRRTWDEEKTTKNTGRAFEGEFETEGQAVYFARDIITVYFSGDGYKITWDDPKVSHVYKREGD